MLFKVPTTKARILGSFFALLSAVLGKEVDRSLRSSTISGESHESNSQPVSRNLLDETVMYGDLSYFQIPMESDTLSLTGTAPEYGWVKTLSRSAEEHDEIAYQWIVRSEPGDGMRSFADPAAGSCVKFGDTIYIQSNTMNDRWFGGGFGGSTVDHSYAQMFDLTIGPPIPHYQWSVRSDSDASAMDPLQGKCVKSSDIVYLTLGNFPHAQLWASGGRGLTKKGVRSREMIPKETETFGWQIVPYEAEPCTNEPIREEVVPSNSGGNPFDEINLSGVQAITVSVGETIAGIQLTYGSGNGTVGQWYGGMSEPSTTTALNSGEYITSVQMRVFNPYRDNRSGMVYLKFSTNERTIVFDTGVPSVGGKIRFRRAPNGYVLGGIHGMMDSETLHTMGVWWVADPSKAVKCESSPKSLHSFCNLKRDGDKCKKKIECCSLTCSNGKCVGDDLADNFSAQPPKEEHCLFGTKGQLAFTSCDANKDCCSKNCVEVTPEASYCSGFAL